ncbi:methyltransferase domain-containing protein [Parasphingorhabdus cellanae]|uniref:Methyltransferase domain-containing protein n=1 Tax=Parasphingorhabdus cellanae TaxID=2806553 RepID=A0ABX7T8A6_9SPHN|nr:methyltransferase domain-containing protein [Parasphingorhabdus cellanae]QTD57736.1 methyltransferase domain-containing protein [Parasphingorhabdus cellanae]
MENPDEPKELFDRARRRRFRDRAFFRTRGNDFIGQIMSEEILGRLSLIKRDFKKCLVIGQSGHALRLALEDADIETIVADSGFASVAAAHGIQCDEDRLPFADHSFDLVINMGTLDSVNDLPGALALTRRILKPDGLLLAAFIGAESLTTLKSLLMQAEGDRVVSHVHPQIDIRTVGDLVSRVGLALPVVDSDGFDLRYREFDKLIKDVRDIGGGNILNDNIRPLSRTVYEQAKAMFQNQADATGKTTEHMELIYLCGWAPHPEQPVPARRGSGQVSLKTALNKPATDS